VALRNLVVSAVEAAIDTVSLERVRVAEEAEKTVLRPRLCEVADALEVRVAEHS
jgi:hypothetical protein